MMPYECLDKSGPQAQPEKYGAILEAPGEKVFEVALDLLFFIILMAISSYAQEKYRLNDCRLWEGFELPSGTASVLPDS